MVRGLILENTWYTFRSLAHGMLPSIVRPFVRRPLLRIGFDSKASLANLPIDMPVLFLSSTDDEIIPNSEMHALHALMHRLRSAKTEEERARIAKGSPEISPVTPAGTPPHEAATGDFDMLTSLQFVSLTGGTHNGGPHVRGYLGHIDGFLFHVLETIPKTSSAEDL